MPRFNFANRRGLTALELLVAIVIVVGLFYVLGLIIELINRQNPTLPPKWEQLNLTSEQLVKISDLQKKNEEEAQAIRNENNRQTQSRNQRIKELKAQTDEIKKDPTAQITDLRHDLSEMEADLNEKTRPYKEKATDENSKAMQTLSEIDQKVKAIESQMAEELLAILTPEQKEILKSGGKKPVVKPGKDK